MDQLLNYIVAKCVKTCDANVAISTIIDEIIMRFGIPTSIISDRNKEFTDNVSIGTWKNGFSIYHQRLIILIWIDDSSW